MINNLDTLLDVVIAQAEIESGVDPKWLSKSLRVPPMAIAPVNQAIQQWTEEEEQFMADHLMELGYDGVAEVLGRTATAVKIHQTRMGLPAPSKTSGWLTMQAAARILGNDIHAISLWRGRGILQGFVTVPGLRQITMLPWTRLYRFAVNPENWCYFKREKVRDDHLRRLIQIVESRWDDEWWTTGQVAEYFGLASSNSVQCAIMRGSLPAVKWGNWHVKRSDALAYRWYSGFGSIEKEWSARADAFILKARDEWDKSFGEIARMMKWKAGRVAYRYQSLKEQHDEA